MADTAQSHPEPTGADLDQWVPRHAIAMVFQVFSLIASGIVIAVFAKREKRSAFHWMVLFLSISDIVWTLSHFINHLEAIINGHVTENPISCAVMAMFTHLGLGWELSWLICLGLYTALVIHNGARGLKWRPSRKMMIAATLICWVAPIVWWTIIGLSLSAYESTGYFCWVRFDQVYLTVMFSDAPLLVSFVLVTGIYCYVIFLLLRHMSTLTTQTNRKTFTREVLRAVGYIVVFLVWVNGYVILTFFVIAKTPGQPDDAFWLYFLALINSFGLLNFLAYSVSERWWGRKACPSCFGGAGASESHKTSGMSRMDSWGSLGTDVKRLSSRRAGKSASGREESSPNYREVESPPSNTASNENSPTETKKEHDCSSAAGEHQVAASTNNETTVTITTNSD